MRKNRLLITLKHDDVLGQYFAHGVKFSTRATSTKGATNQVENYRKEIVKSAIFCDRNGTEHVIK